MYCFNKLHHSKAIALEVTVLHKAHHACKCTPAVERVSGAISRTRLWREVLADVGVPIVLCHHHRSGLLGHGLASCAYCWDVVVIKQSPVRELDHRCPHFATPIAIATEIVRIFCKSWVVCCDTRHSPKTSRWIIPYHVATCRDAEATSVRQPVLYH